MQFWWSRDWRKNDRSFERVFTAQIYLQHVLLWSVLCRGQADSAPRACGGNRQRFARCANAPCGQRLRFGPENWKWAVRDDFRFFERHNHDLQWRIPGGKGCRIVTGRIRQSGGSGVPNGCTSDGESGAGEGRTAHSLSFRPFDGKRILWSKRRAHLGACDDGETDCRKLWADAGSGEGGGPWIP